MGKSDPIAMGFILVVAGNTNWGFRIWIQDFAREKPRSVDLHGFDISLDQVGPKPWLPANVHMHTWDIFQEPPQEFLGYFDIVHVRLITVVIKNNDPRPVLANLTKLLSMCNDPYPTQ